MAGINLGGPELLSWANVSMPLRRQSCRRGLSSKTFSWRWRSCVPNRLLGAEYKERCDNADGGNDGDKKHDIAQTVFRLHGGEATGARKSFGRPRLNFGQGRGIAMGS